MTSAARFDRWWKEERHRRPSLLNLTEDILIDPAARPVDERSFPNVWSYGDIDLDLSYEFDTTSDEDGVTVDIPLGSLDRLDPTGFAWNVPGLRLELITTLMRTLPKPIRKRFSPIPETATDIVATVDPTSGSPTEVLARELTRRGDTIVRPDDFDLERLPRHLLPRYRIVDESGVEVAVGADLHELRDDLRQVARSAIAADTHTLERDGITSWDFGPLPRTVEIAGGSSSVTAYPALTDHGDSVSIRLLATADEQATEMWGGLRRLVMLQLPSPRRLLRAVLDRHGPVPIAGSPYADRDAWMQDCLDCAIDAVLAGKGGAWDEQSFGALVDAVRAELADAIDEVGTAGAAVLDALHEVNLAIDSTRADVYGDVLDDIEEQMDRFVFPGMLTAVGADRVDDVRRYLLAIAYRLDKLPENPPRDRERMATVRSLEDEHDQLAEVLAWTPELVDVVWMLQELRVSLFAQPIGVKGSVSEKKVRAAMEDLLR